MKRIALALLLTLTGCLGGTDTGNPIFPGPVPTLSTHNNIMNTAAGMITAMSCTILTRCNPGLTTASCESALLANTTIDDELGLTGDPYPNLQSLANAELSHTITPKHSAVSQCASDIDALACTDASVVSAYNPALPDPFANVAGMIPTGPGSCKEIFSSP